jgi:hypothetical protein
MVQKTVEQENAHFVDKKTRFSENQRGGVVSQKNGVQ